MGKEGQCELFRHVGAFHRVYPYHLMKANKEFGNPRNEQIKKLGSPKNEGNKTAKNEMNEVLKKDEGQHYKSFHINSEELKDNRKKQIEAKLWNIKWKEVMNGKLERL